jgi:hypothetical protein
VRPPPRAPRQRTYARFPPIGKQAPLLHRIPESFKLQASSLSHASLMNKRIDEKVLAVYLSHVDSLISSH